MNRVRELYPYVRVLASRMAMQRGITDYDDTEDVIGDAMLALTEAEQLYDPKAGTQFRTFAHMRVSHALLDTFRRMGCSVILLPEKISERWQQWCNAYHELEVQLGYAPKESEVADYVGVTLEEYQRARDLCAVQVVPEDAVHSREDGEELSLYEMAGPTTPGPDVDLFSEQQRSVITRYLYGLLPVEAAVLSMMYGLNGDEPLQQEVVSDVLGVSQQYVSQVHATALRKLQGRGLSVELGITGPVDEALSRFE